MGEGENQGRRVVMKITLNTLEMAGLNSRIKQWEDQTGEKASMDFVMTLLSGIISEELDTYLDKVFDIKRKILEDTEKENRHDDRK